MAENERTPPRRDYDPQRFTTPLERGFNKIITPFQTFIANQVISSLLLLCCTIAALLLANSHWREAYEALLHLQAGFHVAEWRLEKSLHHWINDGLMAIFFFVLGLEIKREFLAGELREPRRASLVAVAALGGMLVPALIYYGFNPQGVAATGWGIPMATDTAFAVGVLALLGGRVHKSLMAFLAALAIIDDIGAVLVIALFYTERIVPHYLAVTALLLGVLVLFNLMGIRRPLPYFAVGGLTWLATLESGVHATLAGILVAFTIPARPRLSQRHFIARMRELLSRFRAPSAPGENILGHERQHGLIRSVEETARLAATPLQRWEQAWERSVALVVIPIFALANAGIAVDFATLDETLSHSVTVGVALGLVLGKFLGITGLCWLALKLKIGALPKDAVPAQREALATDV